MNSKIETLLESLGGQKRIRKGLEPIKAALADYGHPEKSVKTIIIGGTNGKGSTTLLISGTLKEFGFRVATYLSPHLQSATERISVDLNPISETDLLSLVEKHLGYAQKKDLTYFEFMTLLYFLWAKENKVDWSIVEVGMGGRLDATNVTEPKACVITQIGFDHEAYLGDTLEKILIEKMGICREGVPIFTGITSRALLDVLKKEALRLQSPIHLVEEAGPFELTNPSEGMQQNAKLAWKFIRTQFPEIPVEIIKAAFKKVKNPGRFEIVSQNPTVILSGDHNLSGIDSLLQTLEKQNLGKLIVLCAFSSDKPADLMVQKLRAVCDELIQTQIKDPFPALEEALKLTGPEDTLLITGSLYLVGALRGRWKESVKFF